MPPSVCAVFVSLILGRSLKIGFQPTLEHSLAITAIAYELLHHIYGVRRTWRAGIQSAICTTWRWKGPKKKEEEEKKQEEIEKKEREEREAKEQKERDVKAAEQKKVQEDAAAKLLMSVQAEILSAPVQPKAAPPANIQALFKEPEELDANGQPRKHKPLTRLEGPPAEERKLRDDEMRRLIQQVPTDKPRAFAFDIDWDAVNHYNIIEKKLRPWVKKKVTEYLGAEEQGMIEFIMRKVSAREKPDKILAELEGFLDEEAENFTLKMWRMLIFEVLRVKAR